MINYDGRKFVSKQKKTENGEVSQDTLFSYHQKGDIVWAEYSGGSVRHGNLIALTGNNGCLEMRYHHLNEDNEFMTGICFSTPDVLLNGKLRFCCMVNKSERAVVLRLGQMIK